MLNTKNCKSIFFLIVFLSFLVEITAAKTVDEMNNIEIYRKASPGVVNISSVVVEYDFFIDLSLKKGPVRV